MKLLDAVNLILPKLGEHGVTRIDIKHPTLAIIIPEVDNTLIQILNKGWWFNEFPYTVPLNDAGELVLGTDAIAFLPDRSEVFAVFRDGKLYNPATLSYTWTKPVRGVVKQFVPFDSLPLSAQQYVWHTALVTTYVTDIGLEKEVQMWQGLAQAAYSDMLAEHIQQRKYSTRQSGRYLRLRRAMRS